MWKNKKNKILLSAMGLISFTIIPTSITLVSCSNNHNTEYEYGFLTKDHKFFVRDNSITLYNDWTSGITDIVIPEKVELENG